MNNLLAYICFALLIATLSNLPEVSAAHFVVGKVNDSIYGQPADGHTVMIWNPVNGLSDNLTDIIGASGNSGTSQYYMFDCELMVNPCQIGDILQVKVIDTGDSYITRNLSVLITGAGYDVVFELMLNEKPVIYSLTVDDDLSSPPGEVDLVPADKQRVVCQGVASDYEDDETGLNNASGVFYYDKYLADSSDDNNYHYTNGSCAMDNSYGAINESLVICSFNVEYYASPGVWNCSLSVMDSLYVSGKGIANTSVNSLLAIGVNSFFDFGILALTSISPENQTNITNFGNVLINLSLRGYAAELGDGLAMNCSSGSINNISIEYMKYNLTSSNAGPITLPEVEQYYFNLSSLPVSRMFGLSSRQNDISNDAVNSTYWRVYVPAGINGSCSGNLVLGATLASGS